MNELKDSLPMEPDLGDDTGDIEDMDGVVVMEDDEGNVVEFEFLDLIEYNEEQYAILLPPDDDEVVILRVDSIDDETEEYTGIDDEDILKAVFDIFRDKFKDEFNFAEE